MLLDNSDPLIGKKVFQYEILALLGRGGVGSVYKARHTILQEIRAIKVLRREHVSDKDLMERFIFEAKTLTKLKPHPNLVQMREFFQHDDGGLFMVMEFLQGITLHEYLMKRGSLTEDEVLEIAIQICRGLIEIHDKGIVHRDISPDNIMMLTEGDGQINIKMIDFGIAKEAFSSSGFTHPGTFVGKFYYSSPEQAGALQEGETLDARSDIYSLGVVMYELITGALPFKSMTPQSYWHEQMKGLPHSFRQHQLVSSVSKPFEAIVFKCLRKDRRKRIKTAREVLQRLEDIQEKKRRARTGYARLEEDRNTRIFKPDQQVDSTEFNNLENIQNNGQIPNKDERQQGKRRSQQNSIFWSALLLCLLFLTIWFVRPGNEEEMNMATASEEVTAAKKKSKGKEGNKPKVASILSDVQDSFFNNQPTVKMTPSSSDGIAADKFRVVGKKERSLNTKETPNKASNVSLVALPTGRYHVTSSPPKATVYFNGRKLEKKTPLWIDNILLEKSYNILLKKKGYHPWKRSVALDEAIEKPLYAKLKRTHGSLVVTTTPSVTVFLDKRPRGKSPLHLAKVASGRHVLRLIKPEVGIDEEITLNIEAGKELTKEIFFTGYLSIPNQSKAKVYLDDQLIGKTPMKKKELIVGNYHLRLEYQGGRFRLREKQDKEYKIFIVINKTLTIE